MIFLVFEGQQKIKISLHFPKTLPCVYPNHYSLFEKYDILLSDSFTFAVSHQKKSKTLLEPLPMNQETAISPPVPTLEGSNCNLNSPGCWVFGKMSSLCHQNTMPCDRDQQDSLCSL